MINLECIRRVDLSQFQSLQVANAFICKSETHTRTLEPTIYRINPKNVPETLHFKWERLL